MTRDIKTVLFKSVGFLFLAAGVGLSTADALDYKQGLASQQWAETAGKILEHQITLLHPEGKAVSYKVAIAYLYHVKNEEFRGTRMAFPDNCEVKERDSHRLLERFEPSKEIVVYYDPQQPSNSTLAKGVEINGYLEKLIRDVVLLAIPLAVLICYLSGHKKSKVEDSKAA
jgi:Protein of unknown function (DUF3592)